MFKRIAESGRLEVSPFTMRLSKAERLRLNELAASRDVTPSEWARSRALTDDKAPPVVPVKERAAARKAAVKPAAKSKAKKAQNVKTKPAKASKPAKKITGKPSPSPKAGSKSKAKGSSKAKPAKASKAKPQLKAPAVSQRKKIDAAHGKAKPKQLTLTDQMNMDGGDFDRGSESAAA